MLEPLQKVSSGWRAVSIAVRSGPWSGHFVGQFLIGELAKFGKEIELFQADRRSAANLKSIEHYLEIAITRDSGGRVMAEGRACERLGGRTALDFQFEIESTLLSKTSELLMNSDH
jgi:hypothetical protein